MVWVASMLLFIVLIGGLAALLIYRRSLEDDESAAEMQVPAEVLIARARAHDAVRENRTPGDGPLE